MENRESIQEVKLDFCVRCRQSVDWALDHIPEDKIFILADLSKIGPVEHYHVVRLCDTCGNFIFNQTKAEGFAVITSTT
jgi:hypothetical protein